MVEYYYHYQLKKATQKYQGYRLWACDCSIQLLPDTDSTRALGKHKYRDSVIASIKIGAYFDVLSQVIARAGIFDKSESDLFCCLKEQLASLPKDVLSIYDRGYGSLLLGYLHNFHDTKYVVRLKTDFSNTVKAFMDSPLQEMWIEEPLGYNALDSAKLLGIEIPKGATVAYRLAKVLLSTGETEVLMTNLPDTFTIPNLSHIYHCRWGIEDCFKVLKTIQMLGIFSGYSGKAVQQDIWSNLLFYNLQTILIQEADIKLQALNEKRKNKPSKNKKKANKGYKINRNIATGTLQRNYQLLFKSKQTDLQGIVDNLVTTYLQNLELIRDKDPPRGANKLGKRERHTTEYNYKRAF